MPAEPIARDAGVGAERPQAVDDRDAATCAPSCCIDPCVALSLEEHDASLTGPVCAVSSEGGLESECTEGLTARFAHHGSPDTVLLVGLPAAGILPTLLFLALSFKEVVRVGPDVPAKPGAADDVPPAWAARTKNEFVFRWRLLFSCLLLAAAIALLACGLAVGLR